MRRLILLAGVLASVSLHAQGVTPAQQKLTGVYVLVAQDALLPRDLKVKSIEPVLSLTPAAMTIQKMRAPADDPANVCQVVGPFRMMEWPANKFELYITSGRAVMLFEDIAHGNKREIPFNAEHPAKLEPSWNGDSIGRWMGDTLTIDTVSFNDRTWLNGAGAPHGDALHLVERLRLIGGGDYLEVVSTADDREMLTRPASYTRYYKRMSDDAIVEDTCEETVPPPPIPDTAPAR